MQLSGERRVLVVRRVPCEISPVANSQATAAGCTVAAGLLTTAVFAGAAAGVDDGAAVEGVAAMAPDWAARAIEPDDPTVIEACQPESRKPATYFGSLNVISAKYWPTGALVGTVHVHSKVDAPHGQVT